MPPEIDETPPRPVVRAVAGSAFLALTGLTGHPSVVQEGVSGARIVAAAGSLAVTAGVLTPDHSARRTPSMTSPLGGRAGIRRRSSARSWGGRR